MLAKWTRLIQLQQSWYHSEIAKVSQVRALINQDPQLNTIACLVAKPSILQILSCFASWASRGDASLTI